MIGGERCPIVDTWWQTENGGILITPLPGVVTREARLRNEPFPGIAPEIVDEQGNPVERGTGGFLVVQAPLARHVPDAVR